MYLVPVSKRHGYDIFARASVHDTWPAHPRAPRQSHGALDAVMSAILPPGSASRLTALQPVLDATALRFTRHRIQTVIAIAGLLFGSPCSKVSETGGQTTSRSAVDEAIASLRNLNEMRLFGPKRDQT